MGRPGKGEGYTENLLIQCVKTNLEYLGSGPPESCRLSFLHFCSVLLMKKTEIVEARSDTDSDNCGSIILDWARAEGD